MDKSGVVGWRPTEGIARGGHTSIARRRGPQELHPFTPTPAKRRGSATVGYRERTVDDVEVQGVSEEYSFLSQFQIARGRHMSPSEIGHDAAVVVVGPGVTREIFRGEDPLGKRVKVGSATVAIVGVAKERGSVLGQSQDNFVALPIGVFEKQFGHHESVTLAVKPVTPGRLESAIDETRMVLRVRHRLRPGEPDDFEIVTTEGMMTLYRRITTGVYSALVGLVAISLVVGGIVVMNIMLVSVTERTREIGIRNHGGPPPCFCGSSWWRR